VNQNDVLKKGTRVKFNQDGKILYGTVSKGSTINKDGASSSVKVVVDGGKFVVTGHPLCFRKDNTPMPRDLPSVMDKYSVTSYKEHKDMSDETVCFSAKICLNGKPFLNTSNTGCGGPNEYHLISGSQEDLDIFFEDAKTWNIQFGDKKPYEPEDTWVSWYTLYRPYGETAKSYISNYLGHFKNLK
jgi:hypothetical protein